MRITCYLSFLALPLLSAPFLISHFAGQAYFHSEMDVSSLNTGDVGLKLRISGEGYLEMYYSGFKFDNGKSFPKQWSVVSYENGSSPQAQVACFQLGNLTRNATARPGPTQTPVSYWIMSGSGCSTVLSSCGYGWWTGTKDKIAPTILECGDEPLAVPEFWSTVDLMNEIFASIIALVSLCLIFGGSCFFDKRRMQAMAKYPPLTSFVSGCIFWAVSGILVAQYKMVELGPRHGQVVGDAMYTGLWTFLSSALFAILANPLLRDMEPVNCSCCEADSTCCATQDIGVKLSNATAKAFRSAPIPNDFSPAALPPSSPHGHVHTLPDMDDVLDNAAHGLDRVSVAAHEINHENKSVRSRATTEVFRAAEDQDPNVRVAACQSLATNADTPSVAPFVVSFMIIRLEDVEARVRLCALHILTARVQSATRTQQALAFQAIDNLLRSDVDPNVRLAALRLANSGLNFPLPQAIKSRLESSIQIAVHDRDAQVSSAATEFARNISVTTRSCSSKTLERISYVFSSILAYVTVISTGLFIRSLFHPDTHLSNEVAIITAIVVGASLLTSISYNYFLARKVMDAVPNSTSDEVEYVGMHAVHDTSDSRNCSRDVVFFASLISPELLLDEVMLGKYPPPAAPLYIRRNLWVGDLIFNVTSAAAPILVQALTGETSSYLVASQVASALNIAIRLSRSVVFSVILDRFLLQSSRPHLNLDGDMAIVAPRHRTTSGLGGRAYIKEGSGYSIQPSCSVAFGRMFYVLVTLTTRITLIYTGVTLAAAESSFSKKPVLADRPVYISSAPLFGWLLLGAVFYSIVIRIIVLRYIFSLVYISASSVSELLSSGLWTGAVYFTAVLSSSHPLFAYLPTSLASESAAHATEASYDCIYLATSIGVLIGAYAGYRAQDVAESAQYLLWALAFTSTSFVLSFFYLIRCCRSIDLNACSSCSATSSTLCAPCRCEGIQNDPEDPSETLDDIVVSSQSGTLRQPLLSGN